MKITNQYIINGKKTPIEGHGIATGPKRKLYETAFEGKTIFFVDDIGLDQVSPEEAAQLIKDAVPWFKSEFEK